MFMTKVIHLGCVPRHRALCNHSRKLTPVNLALQGGVMGVFRKLERQFKNTMQGYSKRVQCQADATNFCPTLDWLPKVISFLVNPVDYVGYV